jgi:hypothetical protein
MPLQTSSLITRKQLACLTGGKVDGAQHTNILNVGTPFMYCGGSAIGIKQGIVHHMCLKEAQNTALPHSVNEPFEVWKQRMKSGNERCINALSHQVNPIPVFWEPKSQEGKCAVAGTGAKGVVYVGHWKIDYVENLIGREVEKLNRERVALIRLSFVSYNHTWHEIIDECQDKSPGDIRSIYSKNREDDESSYEGCVVEGSVNEQDLLNMVTAIFKNTDIGTAMVRQVFELVADQIGVPRLPKPMKRLIRGHLGYLVSESADSEKKGKGMMNNSSVLPINISHKSLLFCTIQTCIRYLVVWGVIHCQLRSHPLCHLKICLTMDTTTNQSLLI